MLTYGGRLRSPDITALLPYMHEEAQRNRDTMFDRNMKAAQLERERLKNAMLKDKAMANRLAKSTVATNKTKQNAQDPGFVPDVFIRSAMGMSKPSDTYAAIGYAAAQNQAFGGNAQPIRNMISNNMNSLMGNAAQANASANYRGGGGGMSREDMIAQLASARQPEAQESQSLSRLLNEGQAQDLARIDSGGRVLAAQARNTVAGKPPVDPLVAEANDIRKQLDTKQRFLNSMYLNAGNNLAKADMAPGTDVYNQALDEAVKQNKVYAATQKEVTALQARLEEIEQRKAANATSARQQIGGDMGSQYQSVLDDYARGKIDMDGYASRLRGIAQTIPMTPSQAAIVARATPEELQQLIVDYSQKGFGIGG